MNTKVVRVAVENSEQRSHFETLFNEYTSALSVNIKPHVVSQLFELSYFHGFICYVSSEPAAVAVCYESYSTYRAKKVLNIHDFMVSSNYRGLGMGKIFLNGIERFCLENDYVKITLEVNENNFAARKLYSSCGFEDDQVVLKDMLHWQKYLV